MSQTNFSESIIKNSPYHVLVLDLEGAIQFSNRATFDSSMDQLPRQSVFSDLASQVEIDKLKLCLQQVQTTQQPQLIEQKTIDTEGATCYWESRVVPILQHEQVTGFILFSDDITPKKTLLTQRRAIFNLTREFLVVLEFSGFYSQINSAFIQALGYTEEEILSTPFIELVHPDDREKTNKVFHLDISQAKQSAPLENRCVCKNGDVIKIEWQRHIDAESKRIIVVGRDITQKREFEQQLNHAQKMEAIGQLAGGIAHDFNNLLMAISANAEMGLLCTSLEEAQKRIRDIAAASTKATALTQKLLTLSRNQPLHTKPLDLNYLIQNFQRKIQRTLINEVKFSFKPEKNMPKIFGDQGQIEQILLNLCVNAADSMPDGGSIQISTSHTSNKGKPSIAHFDITDSGQGIADSIKDKIFDPFFSTKPNGESAGLGLPIVYGIVKKHGGSIDIRATGETGTTMRVSLPIDGKANAADNEETQSLPFGGTETLLVAEDEPLVAKITVETLQKAGYTVLLASNGKEAIELLTNNKSIKLVFLDVVMPQMGGPEAALLIEKSNPELPILFATGYAPSSDTVIPQGHIVMNKPYRGDELLNNIRKLLDTQSTQ